MSHLADDLESDHPDTAEDLPDCAGTRAEERRQAEATDAPTPSRRDLRSDLPPTLVYRWRRDPVIAARVRRLLVWHLAAWGLQDLADVAELVVSELVTNAVQHAHGPEDTLLETRFERLPGGDLRIEVHDANENKPELRQPSADAESGRGLALVDALTGGRWGASGREGVGKVLWAECSAGDGCQDRR
ncbi:ATP-binding protein [Streptomyces sp. NBC_01198]|uniref:ATP-binding protein n=1 Tax=Streptomyces sp. NBC_01198 TaxID=2903769 RepID=UPI002E13AB45|nr:ATP-binding protein [Streptomyces sp. NBC_01198]